MESGNSDLFFVAEYHDNGTTATTHRPPQDLPNHHDNNHINRGTRSRALHDTYLDKYEEVTRLCMELLLDGKGSVSGSSSNRFFCFDIRVIFPLFWVAIKCREPHARRRAVKLLGSLHHQEGSWESTTAAKVAEFVISIEEEGLPEGGGQIPELARVHLVNTTADVERGEIRVSCVLRSEHDRPSWYTRDGRIPDTTEHSPS